MSTPFRPNAGRDAPTQAALGRIIMVVAAIGGLASACRGQTSSAPPIHLISDMQRQPKYQPQSASTFFSDGAGMRSPPDGVVAVETSLDDSDRGRARDGAFLTRIPFPVDQELLARGQGRFDIYCSPCHDKAGSGHGIVPNRGFPAPIDLASDHTRGLADGEIFDVMTSGVRNMPAYRFQVPVSDRWAIVAWVRVLQRSQHATVADVSPELIPRIEPEGASP
jgi:mono/diheme cytochrome c family protein